jgi:carboxyl-terminal processing protease
MSPEEDLEAERAASRPDITDPGQFKERFGFAPIEDRQLEAALDVLRVARLIRK